MRRFYAQRINGDKAWVSKKEADHLAKVLRIRPGGSAVLFDGTGADYIGELLELRQDGALFLIREKLNPTDGLAIDLTVCQAVIKNDGFNVVVQKCTELGVKEIRPFLSSRCVKRPSSPQNFLEKARKTAVEAAKQCGSSIPPVIGQICSINEIITNGADTLFILANENERENTLRRCLRSLSDKPEKIVLIVGSEGGFSYGETQSLINGGAVSVSLGPYILRAETAAPAAAAMIAYEFGQ